MGMANPEGGTTLDVRRDPSVKTSYEKLIFRLSTALISQ